MVPAIADLLLQHSRRIAAAASANCKVVAVGAAAACFAFNLTFHSATFLLGDQNFIAATVRDAAVATAPEFRDSLRHLHHVFPGTDLLYEIIARFSVRVLHVGAETGIRILVSGIGAILAYAWTLWAIRRYRVAQGQAMLLPLLLATSGIAAMFCGYVEVYAPLVGVLVLYIVAAGGAIERRRPLWMPVGCLALAAFLHTMALALLPSLAWLVMAVRTRQNSNLPGRVAIWTCAAMVPLTALARFIPGIGSHIRAPLGEPTAAFSLVHVADVANVLFLACPAIGVVVGSVLRGQAPSREHNAVTHAVGKKNASFALLIAAPLFLFLVAFRSDLGVARDWDLFMPAGVATVWALLESRPGAVVLPDRTVVSITVLCAALTGTWMGINASAERSVARYRAIVSYDLPQIRDPGYAWETLAAYYREHNNASEEIAALEHAVTTSQNPRYRITLGRRYYARGDKDRAIKLISGGLRSDPSNGSARQTLVLMLFFTHRFDELILLCDEGMQREPENPFYSYYKGRALAARHRNTEALEALRRAKDQNPPPQMAREINGFIQWLEEQH